LAKRTLQEKNSADKIVEEHWLDVVIKELNQASYDCANQLQVETGKSYTKYYDDGTKAYNLRYEEAPPTRLLAKTLILSYWLVL
jgi:hypothetical protein